MDNKHRARFRRSAKDRLGAKAIVESALRHSRELEKTAFALFGTPDAGPGPRAEKIRISGQKTTGR